MLLVTALACNLTRNSIQPTPLPPTHTPDTTATALAQLPSATATDIPLPTATLTASATSSHTPQPTASFTPTITPTPLPSSTPLPTVSYASDQVQFYEISSTITGGLDRAWLSFTVTDEQTDPGDDEGQANPVQAVYMVRPDNGQRVRVIELPASTAGRIYWSPTGLHLAYFLRTNDASGLYLLNIQTGRSIRLYAGDSLQPRGIIGHEPVWSPDGTQLAFVLPTAYATDIYLINADGTGFRNLTNSSSYDFWPSWSTGGDVLAFVSDRVFCPTWFPDQPTTCDHPNAAPPDVGHLFSYDFRTNRLSQITDITLNSPPKWINADMVSVSIGSLDPFSDVSALWTYDVSAGSAWEVSRQDGALYASPVWRSDGQRVIYQRITTESSIVLADRFGEVLTAIDQYSFVRFGLAASWSPGGDYLALAGSNGQCPYGLIVLDAEFQAVNTPAQNLLACDPIYDPTGNYLAYAGIRVERGTDGRVDVYIARPDGLGSRNISRDLEGEIQVLGWVGPTFE